MAEPGICADDRGDPEYYSTALEENPSGPASGVARLLRGGAWDVPREAISAVAAFNITSTGASWPVHIWNDNTP